MVWQGWIGLSVWAGWSGAVLWASPLAILTLLMSLVAGVWRSTEWRAPRVRRWLDSSTGGAGLVECALELGARDGLAEELVRRQATTHLSGAYISYPRPPMRSLAVSLCVCTWVTFDPPLSALPLIFTRSSVVNSSPEEVNVLRSGPPERLKQTEPSQSEATQPRHHPHKSSRAEKQSTSAIQEASQDARGALSSVEPMNQEALTTQNHLDQLSAKPAQREPQLGHTAPVVNQAPQTVAGAGVAKQGDPQRTRYELPAAHPLTQGQEAKRSLVLEQASKATLSVPLAPLELRDLSPQAQALLGEVGRLRRLRLHEAHGEHPDQHRPHKDER